jgi:hypothetical protein
MSGLRFRFVRRVRRAPRHGESTLACHTANCTRTVDEHVVQTLSFRDTPHQPSDRDRIPHIKYLRPDVTLSALTCHVLQLGTIPAGRDDKRAFRSEPQYSRAADATRATGHDHRLIIEPSHHSGVRAVGVLLLLAGGATPLRVHSE